MATAKIEVAEDLGTLANNYMFVRGLQSALSTSETNVSAVIGAITTVVRDDCWRHWLSPEGKEVRWNAPDFRLFLESPRPAGCQSRIDYLRRILRGTDVAEKFEEMVRGTRGGNNPTGNNQWVSLVNRDIVTVNQTDSLGPETIPLSPAVPRPRKRDYSREATTGNSVSYAIRRLQKEAPELAEQVIKGEVSANAASIQAGFRDRKAMIPIDYPARAARILVRHMQSDQVKELIVELARVAGFRLETD